MVGTEVGIGGQMVHTLGARRSTHAQAGTFGVHLCSKARHRSETQRFSSV